MICIRLEKSVEHKIKKIIYTNQYNKDLISLSITVFSHNHKRLIADNSFVKD